MVVEACGSSDYFDFVKEVRIKVTTWGEELMGKGQCILCMGIQQQIIISQEGRDWGEATGYNMVTRQLKGLLEITGHEFKKASQSCPTFSYSSTQLCRCRQRAGTEPTLTRLVPSRGTGT